MIVVHPEYVVDARQKRKAVLLPYDEWEKILEAIEEVADIQAYDAAKASPSDAVDFEEAVKEISKGELREL